MVSPILLRHSALTARQQAKRVLAREQDVLAQTAQQGATTAQHPLVATTSAIPTFAKIAAGAGLAAGIYFTGKLLLSSLKKVATQKAQTLVKQAAEKVSSQASTSVKTNAAAALNSQAPHRQGVETVQNTLNGLLTSRRGNFILKVAQTELGNTLLQGLVSVAPKVLPGVSPTLLKQFATPDNIRLVLNSGFMPSLQKNLSALASQSPEAMASLRQFIAQYGEPMAEQVAKQTGIEKQTLMNKLKIFA